MSSARRAALILVLALGLAACGGSTPAGGRSGSTPTAPGSAGPKPPSPRGFLRVDARAHRVTVTLIASYDGTNGGFNFDGYSRELQFTVPRGWTVDVVCKNRGPLRHSCAVVSGAGAMEPAFPGAETPQAAVGLEAGTTASFSFRASRVGVYRFTCLVPGHEAARMWDVLEVARGGKPSAVSLLAGG